MYYCESEPGPRSTAKLLTKDEARRIAANVAMLPELQLKAQSLSAGLPETTPFSMPRRYQ